MSPPAASNRQDERREEEDAALLTGQHQHFHPETRHNQQSRRWHGILALAGLPLLLLCFLPLSAVLHPLAQTFYPTQDSTLSETEADDASTEGKQFEWSPGQDPYRDAHPSALRAAEAAELGPWANQGQSHKGPVPGYTPVGRTKSNGTHDFEKTVIVVSLDGVRADYLTRNMTPHLLSLSDKGLRAEYMEPCFPSLTFPNHWSMLTGLYPSSHGIVANDFYDPDSGEEFVYTDPEHSWPAHFWHGEPMWSTVVKYGMKAAVLMWPGPPKMSDGTKPTYWRAFVDKTPWRLKTDQIMHWLDSDISRRPNLINAYLPEVDQQGHAFGPASDEVTSYLTYVDDFVKSVQEQLEARHLADVVDLIVVSDHGMTSTDNERVVYLDKVLGQDGWDAIEHKEGWPSCGLRFKPGTDEQEMLRRLKKAADQSNGGFQVFTHDTMPSQWHFSASHRIAPIYLVPEVGWAISSVEEHMDVMKGDYQPYGNHGYDPTHPDMHAIFVAHGPFAEDIKRLRRLRGKRQQSSDDLASTVDEQHTTTIPSFKNIELYGLVMRLLEVPKRRWAATNGTGDIWDLHVQWG